MRAGQIVIVDWRDGLPGTGEPNKRRPAVIIGSPPVFGSGLPFELVVPLTGEADLAIAGASILIATTPLNGCTKPCHALSWNVQPVPHPRLSPTHSQILDDELTLIRRQVAACVSVG